jgi:hypothetical protein
MGHQISSLVFNGLTENQFNALMTEAHNQGLAISGYAGSTETHGVEVGWLYDSLKQVLTLNILNTPFFISEETVSNKLDKLVQGVLASTPKDSV